MKRTPLARKTPLVAKSTLERRTPLRSVTPLKATPLRPVVAERKPKQPKATKLPKQPKRSRGERAPARDPGFLAFLRTLPCDCCGTTQGVQAHHWGRHGMATKCSDYEAIPLCYLHHVEGWHRHGTLPGRSRAEWLRRWEDRSSELRELYESQGGRKSRMAQVVDLGIACAWKASFTNTFGGVEPGTDGTVDPAFARAATAWLLRHVWPFLENGDEWSPVLTWHRGELLVQAEMLGNGGVFDVDDLIRGRIGEAA